jgi:hypothetical protein
MADPLTRYRVRSFARPDDATGVVQACAGYAAAIVVASQKVALFGAARAQVEAVAPDGSFREVAVCDPTGVYG